MYVIGILRQVKIVSAGNNIDGQICEDVGQVLSAAEAFISLLCTLGKFLNRQMKDVFNPLFQNLLLPGRLD